MNTPKKISGFRALSVAASLCDRLQRHGIVTPTPIQTQAIPVALSGADLVGLAQTGTGKTLAFALPMMERLGRGGYGIVLAPTRELAQQIGETFALLGAPYALIVGGQSMYAQVKALRNRPQVIVATPGRLEDHLRQGNVRINGASIVVLDEADRMLDMGFAPAIKRILAQTPPSRQTLLFSATFPADIAALAASFMRQPERVQIESLGTTPQDVDQEMVYVPHEEKHTVLAELMEEARGPVLVFARTRHGARKLTKTIRDRGHKAAELHADRTPSQRREALAGFKDGRYQILVATDIAARGIDVREIELVVNFDLPQTPEDYVHRIGRTGRAGASGRAVTLALPEQVRDVQDIEKLLGRPVEVSSRSTAIPAARPSVGARRRSGTPPKGAPAAQQPPASPTRHGGAAPETSNRSMLGGHWRPRPASTVSSPSKRRGRR